MESKAKLESRLTMTASKVLDQAISVMTSKGKEFCSYCVNSYWQPSSEKTKRPDEVWDAMQRNWHRTSEVIGEVEQFLKDRRDEILANLISEKNNKGRYKAYQSRDNKT